MSNLRDIIACALENNPSDNYESNALVVGIEDEYNYDSLEELLKDF